MRRPSSVVWLVLVAALAATVTPAPASGGTNTHAGMPAQAWKALMLRSEALNRRYHLGTQNASPQRAQLLRDEALNARYGNAWTRLTPQQFRTVFMLLGPAVTQFTVSELRAFLASGRARQAIGHGVAVAGASGGGFGWGDSGIGALAALGAVLLAAGVFKARNRANRGVSTAPTAVGR